MLIKDTSLTFVLICYAFSTRTVSFLHFQLLHFYPGFPVLCFSVTYVHFRIFMLVHALVGLFQETLMIVN